MDLLLEICTPSLRSAFAAEHGGADRIELCSGLEMGGLTPGPATLQMALEHLRLNVAVLIRPRGGDFIYNTIEKQLILKEIEYCRNAGADGVVVGALMANGLLDESFAREMKDAAGPLEICFHRAFDQATEPLTLLEQLIELNYDRILTSGQQPTAWEGRALLRDLVHQARGRIVLMAGSGIHPELVAPLIHDTGIRQVHYSAKNTILPPAPHHAKLSFSAPGLPPDGYWETDEVLVKKARRALELVKRPLP
ncbi:MAG: copper homeostasis protein CutC [Saprospiraceae bacterium]|nr:copper homeostasis protein CutC [Saprospiraceae bacterium]